MAGMGDDDAAADDAGQKQGDENIAQDTHRTVLMKFPNEAYTGTAARSYARPFLACYPALDDSKIASRRTMLEACPAGRNLWKHKGNNTL